MNKHVVSVADLLARINTTYAGENTVLFRGQREFNWNLTPTLGRTVFRQIEDPLPTIERRLLSEFERIAVSHISTRSIQDDWDRLTLAQHYGLPTRLLDWTTNPLVALWFAVQAPANSRFGAAVFACQVREADIATADINPLDPPRTLFFRPRHHDARIVAQGGWFSVHKHYPISGRFSHLDSLLRQRQPLRKFRIPSRCFSSIRQELARCGINEATLFPDLQGLCAHLRWQYSPKSDER
jgi:hypothetical protein